MHIAGYSPLFVELKGNLEEATIQVSGLLYQHWIFPTAARGQEWLA